MENSSLGEATLGRGESCSNPPQKLCVKPRGRATAPVDCCGFAEINGALATNVSSGMAPGEKVQLVRLHSQKHVQCLSAWPDLLLSFLPHIDLCRCRVPVQAVPRSTDLGGCALMRHSEEVTVPRGTGCAWAPGATWKVQGRVLAWEWQQLFAIPHSGFKNNWL